MPRSTLFPLAAGLMLAGLVLTMPAAASTADASASADLDRDGFITRAEFGLGRLGTFSQFDTNNDGSLTRAEIGPSRRARPGAPNWASFDADRNGVITRAEVLAAPAPMFDRFDRNRDRRLSGGEAAPVLPFLARHMR
jgi:EF hand